MKARKNPSKRRPAAKARRPTLVAPARVSRRQKPATGSPGTALAVFEPRGGTSMASLMPWTGMTSLREQMDRLFDHFMDFKWEEFPAFGEWTPRLDLSETKENLIVKIEVPAMDPKDIEISLQENLLTIKGEKKQEKEDKDGRRHRVERSYGAFMRSTWLPVAVDDKRVEARFKNGLLTVTLPKMPGAKATEIPVRAE
jgi:HSP20 family protein